MAQAGAKKKHTNSAQPIRSQTSQRIKSSGSYSGQTEAKRRVEKSIKSSAAESAFEQERFLSGGLTKPSTKKSAPKSVQQSTKKPARRTMSDPNGASQRSGQKKPNTAASKTSASKAYSPKATASAAQKSFQQTSLQRSVQKSAQKSVQKSARKPVQQPVKKASKRRADIAYRRWLREQIKRKEQINRVMLWVTGCIVAVALFVYVDRMAELSSVSKQINQLREDITDLKEQKQYKEVELAANQNIDRVSDEATRRLGMITPSPEQTRYISISEYLD